MYTGTVLATLKYCSSLFYTRLFTANNRLLLNRLRRSIAINTACLYRTVSVEAAGVIASFPPFEFEVALRSLKYLLKNGYPVPDFLFFPSIQREEDNFVEVDRMFREALLDAWQSRWDASRYGRWTRTVLPSVRNTPSVSVLDFYVSQALSAHGCFRAYLHKRNRVPSPLCECGEFKDPYHVFIDCPRHPENRPAPLARIDPSNIRHLSYMRSVIRKLWSEERSRLFTSTTTSKL